MDLAVQAKPKAANLKGRNEIENILWYDPKMTLRYFF